LGLQRRYVFALSVNIAFLGLRAFSFYYNILILVIMIAFDLIYKSNKRITLVLILTPLISVVSYYMLSALNLLRFLDRLIEHDPLMILASGLGLARFYIDLDITVVSNETGRLARLIMIDGIIIPLLFPVSAFVLSLKGLIEAKKLAILTMLIVVSTTLSYMAIQGNFPLRKLLPCLPLMYIVTALFLEMVYHGKLFPYFKTFGIGSFRSRFTRKDE
jgi:hypothetical protein